MTEDTQPSAAGALVREPATPVVKATFIGRDGTETSNVIQTDKLVEEAFQTNGAIAPPLDPEVLCHLHEMSGGLRTCIDAYATNIDGMGHRLEPMLDPNDENLHDKVREALYVERLIEIEAGDDEEAQAIAFDQITEPTDAEVEQRIKAIEREAMRERIRAEQFFQFCCLDESFVSLRMRTRQDLETLGSAFWEVLRNASGEIVQFVYTPSQTMRLLPQEDEHTEVEMHVRRTFITADKEVVRRKFRKFIQVLQRGKKVIYFKEFGDQRVYSSKTGKPYDTLARLRIAEPKATPATEILNFRIHSPRTCYGVPRWAGELVNLLGTRHAQEVNMMYFESRSIPPMAILVSGGRLTEDAVQRLSTMIENEVKGKKNFHKTMILEAESKTLGAGNNGTVKVEIVPLTHVQQSDAQFLQYMERNNDTLGQVFRLPRLLRGDVQDVNRASASVALEFSEQQVFGPLRNEFDWMMNRKIMPELGVNYWEFKSKGPDFSNPTDVMDALHKAAESGFLLPEELRDLASRVFGCEFKKLEADWMEQPLQLTLAGVTNGGEEDDPTTEEPEKKEKRAKRAAMMAQQMIALRREFVLRASLNDRQQFDKAHELANPIEV